MIKSLQAIITLLLAIAGLSALAVFADKSEINFNSELQRRAWHEYHMYSEHCGIREFSDSFTPEDTACMDRVREKTRKEVASVTKK